ncbi:MAG: LytR C-terminal domain-containing protein [Candidatus Eisenbacteria bacterium]|nr:LytR C-terminal domain-containing protein [Candidatus Eisenbacteria bacterium]
MAGSGNGARVAIAALALIVAALAVSLVWSRVAPRSDGPRAGAKRHVIRVQVLNGSGEGGVASRVASYLREGGYQVVEVRNAERSDYFATLVVSRRSDLEAARSVARYLGGPPVIRQEWESDLAEVTVVLGSDRSRLRLE